MMKNSYSHIRNEYKVLSCAACVVGWIAFMQLKIEKPLALF